MTTLCEIEWFLESSTAVNSLLQSSPFVYKGPTSLSVIRPHPDVVQRSIQQYMKLSEFLQAFQRPRELNLRVFDWSPVDRTPSSVCPYSLPSGNCNYLLEKALLEEFTEGVFEALGASLTIVTRLKGSARVCEVDVGHGAFLAREERGSSREARTAGYVSALQWAAPELLQQWRLRHRMDH